MFRSFPSTRAASGERLFFKAAAVSPNPLPPEVANRMTGVVQHYVIPNPEEGTEKMLKISALDKD